MMRTNKTEYYRLFADWEGKHNWQEYDSQKAFYPTYDEFIEWWKTVEFRYYTVKPDRLMALWGVGRHPSFTSVSDQELLLTKDFEWLKLYENSDKAKQWTIDNTIKVMVSIINEGVLARANIRRNGPWNINKGAKLALSCYQLDIDMPMVVALDPNETWPVELDTHLYEVIKEPKDLTNVYPNGSRAVLLPRTHLSGPPNIDCWTLHKGWETYKDYGHTQFPEFDWDKFFKFLWSWCKDSIDCEMFSFYHYELKRHVLVPYKNLGTDKWQQFWKECSNEEFL